MVSSYKRSTSSRYADMPDQYTPCFFCGRLFSRADSARRHAKQCDQRAGRPIPTDVKRGRGPKACDRCALSKLACDTDEPCETCLSRGRRCSYDWVEGVLDARSKPTNPISSAPQVESWDPREASARTQDSNDATRSNVAKNEKTLFLLRYMSPDNKNILNVWNALETSSALPDEAGSPPRDLLEDVGQLLSHKNIDVWNFPLIWNNLMPSGMILDPLEAKDLGAPIFGDLNRTSLDQRLPELLDLIHLTDACDVSSASRSSRINARFIFEKLLGAHHKQLFEHKEFELMINGDHDCVSKTCDMHIELLNATVIVIYLQLGMTDKRKRCRMRMLRIHMLVNAGRTLSLFTTRKLATQETSCSTFAERWYDWIKTERRIRTAFAIFLIDSELAIFFRTLNQSLKSWKCYWDKKLSLEKLCNAEDLAESRLGEILYWLARLLVHIKP
ncbi:hypothetical protein FOXYS1_4544 [Fusarium oxysporum]|uniref:Zn(2)-C6 fungal-type domain-containing protein n=1 Tax=Fusarium oxysporum TaxID=5507 RepID=A0A8H5EL01_FUSOX|nr:hypothetical protein FOXYS1_4544 [Fusarium oxysporum]